MASLFYITFAADFKKVCPLGRIASDKHLLMKTNANIQLITAAILSIGGMIMLYCGVFIEPQGQIHESLLIGFGEVATFAGALFGIDYTYKHKYRDKHPEDK